MDKTKTEIIKQNIKDHFQLGQKISIKRTFANDNESYPSYVKDFNEKNILIEILTKAGTAIPVYTDKEIELASINKEGIWSGRSQVISIENTAISGIWIKTPEYLEKVQRREYMRWDMTFPVKVFVFDNEEDLREPNEIIEVKVNNISGGGIAVLTKEELPRNKVLYINIQHNGIFLCCKIKYIHEQFDTATKNFITGYQFLEIDRKLVDKIHKVGLNNQLELRRKGLI